MLLYIEDQEAEYKARGYEPGECFWHDYLREKAGGYALARQWAGHEQELEQLHKELNRLRSLISTAALRPRASRSRPRSEDWMTRGGSDNAAAARTEVGMIR